MPFTLYMLHNILNYRVLQCREVHPTESYNITKAATKEAMMAPTCKDFNMSVTSLRPSLVGEACEPVLVLVLVLVAEVPLDTAEELSRVII